MLPNTWFTRVEQKAISGTPDVLCCIRGCFIALELKRDSKARVSEIQKYIQKQIRKALGRAFIVSPEGWADVLDLLTIIARKKEAEASD